MAHPDLSQMVSAQHATVRRLFKGVFDASTEQRASRFAELARYLAIHEAAEQAYLHRVDAEAETGEGSVPVSRQRVVEEQEATTVITRLEAMGPNDATFTVQFGLLEEAVEHHATSEEQEEIPVLQGLMSQAQIADALTALNRVDSLFEDRSDSALVPAAGGFARQHEAALRAMRDHAPTGHAPPQPR